MPYIEQRPSRKESWESGCDVAVQQGGLSQVKFLISLELSHPTKTSSNVGANQVFPGSGWFK